ncbi:MULTISPECIES: PAAR domain-containing protein [unclassified Pseudomonas]|uniref:PAAR domain-containing protein n=1 Tax=unclassified Pseudomonas TaxID=196821 RepID=UPI000C8868AC|nr:MULTISPECIES: PAAR domain-containing protein [unclassified Pseudomonas]PMZ85755.1 PAAR domain-containing protein [Pseudomonas sp. FW215-T2]PNA08387.1 PAAR domain-containing protein [Pseudomonas sp. FW215-R3]PNB34615.1 PAAR domain-containing protein [Pseudomonas sp. FW305-131]
MLPLVRMGDSLSPFGGEVLEGHYEAFGIPVACVGDQARCDLHGLTRIKEGTSIATMDDTPMALDGCQCECGCQLVSSLAASSMMSAP